MTIYLIFKDEKSEPPYLNVSQKFIKKVNTEGLGENPKRLLIL